MLSYQHAYHAGNLADVHKHALLCGMLSYLCEKDKPLCYLETHAGRGLYNLSGAESKKTGEAQKGILTLMPEGVLDKLPFYKDAITDIRSRYGDHTYPGSPMLAAHILRANDQMHICEKHPAEGKALTDNMQISGAHIHLKDGYETINGLVPPTPKRGLLMIDPSYEVKTEYLQAADFAIKMHKKWPVGIICIWYPILADQRHKPMTEKLRANFQDKLHLHEVSFDKIHQNHGLIGSGMAIVQPPYALETLGPAVSDIFLKNNG